MSSRVAAACPQTLPHAEARQRAEAFARQMGERFGLQWEWQGDSLRFAASSGAARGVHGDLVLGADRVTVSLHVPLLLRFLSHTLEGKARLLLRETFAPGCGVGHGSRSIPKRSIIR